MVKVIKTVVDGEGGRANRMDTKGNIYLPIHMGYRNCYYRYMESLGYKVTVCPNGTLTVVEEDPMTNTNDEEQCDYIKVKVENVVPPHESELSGRRHMQLLLYICYQASYIIQPSVRNAAGAGAAGDNTCG